MKKVFVLSVLIVFIAAACHKKAVPTTAVPAPATDSAAVAAAAPDPALVEAGKTVFNTKCTKCHAAKVVENYTAERWTGILKSMIPKAKLDDTESAQVTAFVMAGAKK